MGPFETFVIPFFLLLQSMQNLFVCRKTRQISIASMWQYAQCKSAAIIMHYIQMTTVDLTYPAISRFPGCTSFSRSDIKANKPS